MKAEIVTIILIVPKGEGKGCRATMFTTAKDMFYSVLESDIRPPTKEELEQAKVNNLL
jgi:hypothetical protein